MEEGSVLQFMRTNITYQGKPIVGIWIKGAAKYLDVTCQVFTRSVIECDLGHNQEKPPFLKENCKDTAITDNNSVRRSCTCGYLDELTSGLAEGLKQG